jgi:hypothetical protein
MGTQLIQTATYGTAARVLNRARSILNLMNFSGTSELADTNPDTWEYLNEAIEYTQDELANNGISTFTKEVVLSPILPVAVNDPNQYTNVSYAGYFDGLQTHATPVLPQDLLVPWRMWERQTGTNQPFQPMGQPEDGLPSYFQSFRIREFEWRGDAIYLLGATQPNDLRCRYEARLPFVTQPNDIIPMRGTTNALANLVAYYYAKSRGSVQADNLKADADQMIKQICNRNARKNQRRRYRRQAWGGNTGDWGIGGTY